MPFLCFVIDPRRLDNASFRGRKRWERYRFGGECLERMQSGCQRAVGDLVTEGERFLVGANCCNLWDSNGFVRQRLGKCSSARRGRSVKGASANDKQCSKKLTWCTRTWCTRLVKASKPPSACGFVFSPATSTIQTARRGGRHRRGCAMQANVEKEPHRRGRIGHSAASSTDEFGQD
jgi:hypothetical protein